MEDIREGEEEVGIYEEDNDMDEEVFNELESAREESMVEREMSIEEEIVVDDGINMLDGYMRDYSQSPPGWQHPPTNEGSR